MKTGKTSSYLKYALGEIVLVVLGILIALSINNWNETIKTKKAVNTTLGMLKDEINANNSKINRVKDYHIMIRDTLQKIEMPKTEKDIESALNFWRGMNTPRLQDAAFQTAIQSGVSKELNPKLLQSLNSLYTYQESYNDYTSKSTEIFFNADFTDIKSFGKMMASVQMTMNDLYYYERELNNIFKNSLAKIDSLNAK